MGRVALGAPGPLWWPGFTVPSGKVLTTTGEREASDVNSWQDPEGQERAHVRAEMSLQGEGSPERGRFSGQSCLKMFLVARGPGNLQPPRRANPPLRLWIPSRQEGGVYRRALVDCRRVAGAAQPDPESRCLSPLGPLGGDSKGRQPGSGASTVGRRQVQLPGKLRAAPWTARP